MDARLDHDRLIRLSQTLAASLLSHVAGYSPNEVRNSTLTVLAAFLIEAARPGCAADAIDDCAEQLARAAAMLRAGANRVH